MKYILALFILFVPVFGFSKTLATCTTQTEHAYYANIGIIQAPSAGWKISSDPGTVTLNQLSEGDYDILFIDATKEIHSAKENGAQIKLLWKNIVSMAFSAFYPNQGIEIYHFMKENTGKYLLTILTTKEGDTLFYKSSLENGTCSFVSLD